MRNSVWVVRDIVSDNFEIVGIYSSEELADRAIVESGAPANVFSVEEMPLDSAIN